MNTTPINAPDQVPFPAPTTEPTFQTLLLHRRGPLGVLTLNRPRARNAIDSQMRAELKAAVDHIAADPTYRALIITGAGSAFCSGGDIRGMQERVDQGARAGEIGWRRQRELHETLGKLYDLDRPTLAAINGPALGLGLDLALTCDFVWSSTTAVLAAAFVKRGLVPDGGGMFHLPRRIGVSRTKELVFSGRSVDALEAESIGLVDQVAEPETLLDRAVDFLSTLTDHPATAQAMAKNIINRTFELSLDEVNTLASQAQAYCYSSADHQDSVRSFLQARSQAASS